MANAPRVIRSLSSEEFRREWEPKGWRLIVIGPTSTWREEWGEWEAIRDIVQNSLDETESYRYGYDQDGLFIEDDGKGFSVKDILLGPPKRKLPYARGKFGEGMKIAALSLLRRGYGVKVETVGMEIWMVFLRVPVDGDVAQLAALWRPNGRKVGTRFHIIGYRGSAFEDRFVQNIPSRFILHRGPSIISQPIQRFNLLLSGPYAGRIYARDIYLMNIESPFGYNLWGFEMAPDRHGPASEAEMWRDAGRLWATVRDVGLLRRLLRMVVAPPKERTRETDHIIFSLLGHEPTSGRFYLTIAIENRNAWTEAWKAEMGEKAVLSTTPSLDTMVRYLGYSLVQTVRLDITSFLAHLVPTDKQVVRESQERLSGVVIIPDDHLSKIQRVHLEMARGIANFYYHGDVLVRAAHIPEAAPGVRTDGMYDKHTREIFIAPMPLNRATTTLDVLIHELAHHISGAEDLTAPHAEHMTEIAARIIRDMKKGEFDHLIKEAVW
jgi:hypothetical protein